MIASGTIRGSAVKIPSTSVQNSTFEEPRPTPTKAALKSEPFLPSNPYLLSFQEQIKPGKRRILAFLPTFPSRISARADIVRVKSGSPSAWFPVV